MNRLYQQNLFGKNILTLEDYFSKMKIYNNDVMNEYEISINKT